MESLKDRFWKKVDRNGPIQPHVPNIGACWIWTASKNPMGYGYFNVGKHRCELAHRVAWLLVFGATADSCVLHHCDNPACVRPDHLFPGTRTDNSNDKVRKGRARGASMPGESNPCARLTDSVVREIRSLANEGHTGADLARKFGISKSTVCRVIRGERWEHVR